MNDDEELRALLQRYARAADERDIDGPRRAVPSRGGDHRLRRVADLGGMARHHAGTPSLPAEHAHDRLTRSSSPGRGWRPSADLDSYAVVFQLSDPTSGAADLTLGIRYLDHAVVHEGRWVLATPAGHDPVDAVTAWPGQFARSCVGDDPGWRR